MGKDKFIQLMRAGISYDRNSGKFVVRRLDSLESVEERLAGILSRPIKFARPSQDVVAAEEGAIQECYVDGQQVHCDRCEFVEACPTHTITAMKFCLCDETVADPKGYEKYAAKNSTQPGAPKAAKTTRRRTARKKR